MYIHIQNVNVQDILIKFGIHPVLGWLVVAIQKKKDWSLNPN